VSDVAGNLGDQKNTNFERVFAVDEFFSMFDATFPHMSRLTSHYIEFLK